MQFFFVHFLSHLSRLLAFLRWAHSSEHVLDAEVAIASDASSVGVGIDVKVASDASGVGVEIALAVVSRNEVISNQL